MVFERELDLEDFNETARAYFYAGAECHRGSVLSDGCIVIEISVGSLCITLTCSVYI